MEKDFFLLYDVENYSKGQWSEWEESLPGPPLHTPHSHTHGMMKTPSVSRCNDTAGFHAALQNTAKVWESLDIRRYATATFFTEG